MCDEVDILLYGKLNVRLVFRRERRQIDVLARHIHAFVGSEESVVLHLGHNHRALDVENPHVEGSVIKENVVPDLDILREIRIGNIHDVVGGVYLRAAENLHGVARLVGNGRHDTGRANLRPLGVNEQGDVRRYFTRVTDDVLNSFRSGMSGVHAHHIHPREEQLAQEINLTVAVADGAYNLGLFHSFIIIWPIRWDG